MRTYSLQLTENELLMVGAFVKRNLEFAEDQRSQGLFTPCEIMDFRVFYQKLLKAQLNKKGDKNDGQEKEV